MMTQDRTDNKATLAAAFEWRDGIERDVQDQVGDLAELEALHERMFTDGQITGKELGDLKDQARSVQTFMLACRTQANRDIRVAAVRYG